MGCEYGLPTSENTCALDDALTLTAIQLDQVLETANKVPTKPSREVQSSSRNRADGPDSLSASKLESESLSRTQVSCKPNDRLEPDAAFLQRSRDTQNTMETGHHHTETPAQKGLAVNQREEMQLNTRSRISLLKSVKKKRRRKTSPPETRSMATRLTGQVAKRKRKRHRRISPRRTPRNKSAESEQKVTESQITAPRQLGLDKVVIPKNILTHTHTRARVFVRTTTGASTLTC